MKTAAQHDSKWELIMAESTKGSWKDRDNHCSRADALYNELHSWGRGSCERRLCKA